MELGTALIPGGSWSLDFIETTATLSITQTSLLLMINLNVK